MTTNPDSITLFCGAQVSPHTAEVYGFQMRRFADWMKRELCVLFVVCNTITPAGGF